MRRLHEIPLSKALEGYSLSYGPNNISRTTLDLYVWALRLLVVFLKDKDFASVTADDLDRFMAWLAHDYHTVQKNKTLSPSSQQNAWKAIHSFFSWGLKKNLIIKRVDLDLIKPHVPDPDIQPLSEEEMRALLAACGQTRLAITTKRKPFTMPRKTVARYIPLLIA